MDSKQKRDHINQLHEFLTSLIHLVDAVIVEGKRDERAMRALGYEGELVSCCDCLLSNYDLAADVSKRFHRVLILTDFDSEGEELNRVFTRLLERHGVVVEIGLRGEVGRFMARINVYAVESIDNIAQNLESF